MAGEDITMESINEQLMSALNWLKDNQKLLQQRRTAEAQKVLKELRKFRLRLTYTQKQEAISNLAMANWLINSSAKEYDENKIHKSKSSQEAKRYMPYINSIIENAVLLNTEVSKNGSQSLFMHIMYAVADIGHGKELLKLYVEELNDANSNDDIKRAYQLLNIEKQQSGVTGSKNVNSNSPSTQTAVVKTISELYTLVKQLR